MKDKTKIRLKRLAVALMIIVIFCCVYGIKYTIENKKEFNESWGFSLPNCKELYKENDLGWFGEGTQYSVYKLKKKDAEWANKLRVKNITLTQSINYKDEKLATDTVNSENQKEMETTFSTILIKINIKEKYKPNFNEDYNWVFLGDVTTDCQIAIYYPNSRKLILYRSIY